jgi:hypothetical protein
MPGILIGMSTKPGARPIWMAISTVDPSDKKLQQPHRSYSPGHRRTHTKSSGPELFLIRTPKRSPHVTLALMCTLPGTSPAHERRKAGD